MTPVWEFAPAALAALGLAACGAAAWLAWRSGHRPATLPLALALFLISFQRGYGLFASWWLHEPLGTLSLGLDLTVAVLALTALFLLRRHEPPEPQTPEAEEIGRRSLARSALLLGAVALTSGLVLGSLAYVRSRDILLRSVQLDTLALAHSLETQVDPKRDRIEMLQLLRQGWEASVPRYRGTSFWIVGPGGLIEYHSERPEWAGRSVHEVPELPQAATATRMLRARGDTTGIFQNLTGGEEFSAFSYSPGLGSVLIVDVPRDSAQREVQRALLPWVFAFATVLGLLLPLALIFLFRAFAFSGMAARRAEHALELSETRLQSLVQHLPVLLWVLDRKGRFTLSEGRGLESLGLHPGEAVGQTVDEVYGDIPALKANHRLAFEGKAFAGQVTVKDRVFESWYEPLRDEEGQVEGILGVSIDVTERRRAEEALESSLTKLKAIFQNALDAILLIDSDRRVVDANPAACAMMGLSQPEMLGSRVTDLAYLPDEPDRDAAWVRFLKTGGISGIVRSRLRDGRTVHLEVQGKANILPGLHLVMMRDVTDRERGEEERRQLEDRLERARRLESLGVLAGGIAHDFNNLLMTILGSAELALQSLGPEDRAQSQVQRIVSAGRRASELTQQMLTYSGRTQPRLEPVRLDELVTETVHLIDPLIPERVVLVEEHDPQQPPVEGDAVQLRQVVLNLFTNAVEAMSGEPGTIHVSTRAVTLGPEEWARFDVGEALPPGPCVLLEVRDTGVGMSEEVQSKLFEPFFSTKFEGRGLGLPSTLGVIRSHGGAIRVESSPGHGAAFQVVLPAAVPASPPSPESPEAPAERNCVLVADDEPALLQLLQEALSRHGFDVLVARDGREALEVFREHPRISAVLLDMKMPRLGGLDTCREMQRLRPGTPILLATGYAEEVTRDAVGEAGAAGVLHKPFRTAELVERLREAMRGAAR